MAEYCHLTQFSRSTHSQKFHCQNWHLTFPEKIAFRFPFKKLDFSRIISFLCLVVVVWGKPLKIGEPMPVKVEPPPPANSKQLGATTTLLYNGSRFKGSQKSKGNSYEVEVVLQVSLMAIIALWSMSSVGLHLWIWENSTRRCMARWDGPLSRDSSNTIPREQPQALLRPFPGSTGQNLCVTWETFMVSPRSCDSGILLSWQFCFPIQFRENEMIFFSIGNE